MYYILYIIIYHIPVTAAEAGWSGVVIYRIGELFFLRLLLPLPLLLLSSPPQPANQPTIISIALVADAPQSNADLNETSNDTWHKRWSDKHERLTDVPGLCLSMNDGYELMMFHVRCHQPKQCQNARVNATFSRSYTFSYTKTTKIDKKRIFAAEAEPR